MTVEDSVRRFIAEQLSSPVPVEDLSNDYPLITNNAIDSMGVFEVVTFLEQEFQVEVGDEELVLANFGTISSIARLVQSKQQGEASA